MEFRLLGPLEVLDDGRPLELGGAKQRALIALLLLNANRVVSKDRLIDALWEEEPTATAQKALQVYVSQLRKLLGKDRVQTKAPGYLVRIEPEELDLACFQLLQKEGRLQEALSLWRGPPLSEFAYQRFAQPEIARLEELGLAVLEERIDRDLAEGRHAELVGELEALVQEHPLRERLRGQLMLALYRSGRQAEALDAYHVARQALVEELGIEPGRSLRELHQAILNQDSALEVDSAQEEAGEAARGAFVGRERELEELSGGLDDALAGRGRLFLLVGEPGIGKSRLAEELIRSARERGARILVGRCWEAGGAPAYWPWVQSLRAYIRETEPETLRAQLGGGAADLVQILPELSELLPDLSEPPSLESEGARFRLFDSTAAFLRSVSQSRPILLVLDDLHAADASSLLLLQFLAREIRTSRILLVAAFRDVDPLPDEPLTTMLAEVAREPLTRRLTLRGLSEQDVAEYVELTAAEIASPELSAALYEETEGNPLFVGETVRLLALEGLAPDSSGTRFAIPQSVRDVIARRLSHLSAECNRVLVLASVLGREFSLEGLARMTGLAHDDLLETLDEAMSARVVSSVPGGPGRLRFAHVLIRDSLYEGLTTVRRVRLHRLVVETLEALHGDEPGPHLAELAHHSIAGSEFAKGLAYAQRAGDRALALLAYEEAARLYETALEALDLARPAGETRRCHLLLSLGEAEIRAGNTPVARKAFLDAAAISRRLGLSQELARAAMGYGGRIVWARAGDDARLVPLLEEGLAGLKPDDVELRPRLLARLAGALRDEPARRRRDTLSNEAVDLARRSGNLATLAYALDARASAIVAPDTIAECMALADELFEVASRIGDNERVVAAHHHRMIGQLLVGDGRAEVDHAAATRIADELRQPPQLWQACANEALLALSAGRFAEAEKLVPEAFALGERAQRGAALPIYRLHRLALYDFRGSLQEVEQEISDLVAEFPARPVLRCARTYLYARLGRTEDARRELGDLAAAGFAAVPFDQEWLFAMSFLAEASAIVNDVESARVLYELLLPWAALNTVDVGEGIRGSVSRYLGLLAVTMERAGEAARHYEDALEMNQRTGTRPWLAHTQRDYAEMLLARGEPGDAERARELVDAALATYRELGMETHAAEAATLLRETVPS